MAYGLNQFSREHGITEDILTDFRAWYALLVKWNARINLVSKSAMDEFWLRHALDSWQVAKHVPESSTALLDLGSGGGFPALALAISAKHQKPERHITLVESAGKKANFLRTVIRELGLPATVKSERVENLDPEPFDVITARAFAPLPKLLSYAAPFWEAHTLALLLKGQGAADEITDARQNWAFEHDLIPSKSDPDASLLKLSHLKSKH